MAQGKKTAATKPQVTAESIERDIRDAVSKIPGINDLPESAYCRLLADACDLIKVGCEMRLSEIGED